MKAIGSKLQWFAGLWSHPLALMIVPWIAYGILLSVGMGLLGWSGDRVDFYTVIFNIAFIMCVLGYLAMPRVSRWLRRKVARWAVGGLEMPGSDTTWYMLGPSRGQWKNLCCNGFKPLTVQWQEAYDQWPADSVIKQMSQKDINKHENRVRHVLFDGYAKPVVAWCEANLTNPYYCWMDQQRLNIMIPDQGDRTLWQLTWGDKMPSVSDIQQAVEKYEEFQGKNLVDGA